MINDNSNDSRWPRRKIVTTINVVKTMPDREPYQEIIVLDCGHWCYNTYGDGYQAKFVGDLLGCRPCFFLEKLNDE